jgi:acetoacetate decarboxylase
VHNDDFLASALVHTRLWGCFMTDLHPTIWESDSRKLGRIPSSAIDEAVATLVVQARLLEEVDLIVAVGSATHRHLQKRLLAIQEQVGNPNLMLVRIPHYSKANARVHKQRRETYRLLVEEALADNS